MFADADILLSELEDSADVEHGLAAIAAGLPVAGDARFQSSSGHDSEKLTYMLSLRHVIHEILCTNSPRYADLRRRARQGGNTLVTFLATTVGKQFTIELGMAVPVAAASLYVVLKIGVSGWCRLYSVSANELTLREAEIVRRPRSASKKAD
jgi:hypothetical protein